MIILVHILTILFGIVTFVSSIMIFSFIGCSMISLIAIFVPHGELLVFPLFGIDFGLIMILMTINDLYS